MPTPQEWQQRAEQWVPAFMAQHPEITAADTLFTEMRESDMYVPREYVRDEWRDRKAEGNYMDIVAMMDDSQRVPQGWKRQSAMNYRQKQVWTVEMKGVLTEGSVPVERTITVESDENLQIGPILDAAWGYAFAYGLNLYDDPPTMAITEAMYV